MYIPIINYLLLKYICQNTVIYEILTYKMTLLVFLGIVADKKFEYFSRFKYFNLGNS